MRVQVVTGIFPPDVGGPATHAYDVVEELRLRGHEVSVLTLTDDHLRVRPEGVTRLPRRWPWPVRTAVVIAMLALRRRRYDVIYDIGMLEAAANGGRLARRPVVARVVSDAAWERGRREGLTTRNFAEFQSQARPHWRLRLARRARDAALRRCHSIVVPTPALADAVIGWLGPDHVVYVVPNGVRAAPGGGGGAEPAVVIGATPALSVLCVGRLIADKRIDVLVDAAARTAGVRLEIVGEGPEHRALGQRAHLAAGLGEIRLVGALTHDEVMTRLSHADVLAMASLHEGLPHTVIEALTVGTPVVAVRVAGVEETTVDGHDSLLLTEATPEAFSKAFETLRDDPGFRARLATGAAESGRRWGFSRTADAIEARLAGAVPVRPDGTTPESPRKKSRPPRPLAVYMGKTSLGTGESSDLLTKMALHHRHLDQVSVTVGLPGVRSLGPSRVVTIPRLRPRPLGAALFHGLGPVVAVVVASGRRPSAVICQSPREAVVAVIAARLVPLTRRPRLQVEVHGDWAASHRHYGGSTRRLIAPFADRACRWSLVRADQVRVLGPWLEDLVRAAGYTGPVERYPTFSDYGAFIDQPPVDMPGEPVVLFVGVLERVKGVDLLLDAWAEVVRRLPVARLRIVGSGSRRGDLLNQAERLGIIGSVELCGRVPRADLVGLLDTACSLVVPSRSEGMGRVVIEAMGRARPVVAFRTGGIPDLVIDGETGLLVEPADTSALAEAIVAVAGDRTKAARMGRAGRRRVVDHDPRLSYETGIERLASWIAQE